MSSSTTTGTRSKHANARANGSSKNGTPQPATAEVKNAWGAPAQQGRPAPKLGAVLRAQQQAGVGPHSQARSHGRGSNKAQQAKKDRKPHGRKPQGLEMSDLIDFRALGMRRKKLVGSKLKTVSKGMLMVQKHTQPLQSGSRRNKGKHKQTARGSGAPVAPWAHSGAVRPETQRKPQARKGQGTAMRKSVSSNLAARVLSSKDPRSTKLAAPGPKKKNKIVVASRAIIGTREDDQKGADVIAAASQKKRKKTRQRKIIEHARLTRYVQERIINGILRAAFSRIAMSSASSAVNTTPATSLASSSDSSSSLPSAATGTSSSSSSSSLSASSPSVSSSSSSSSSSSLPSSSSSGAGTSTEPRSLPSRVAEARVLSDLVGIESAQSSKPAKPAKVPVRGMWALGSAVSVVKGPDKPTTDSKGHVSTPGGAQTSVNNAQSTPASGAQPQRLEHSGTRQPTQTSAHGQHKGVVGGADAKASKADKGKTKPNSKENKAERRQRLREDPTVVGVDWYMVYDLYHRELRQPFTVRPYVDQFVTEEINGMVTDMLQDFVRFQKRAKERNPAKASTKRFFLCGVREVRKHAKLGKIKCVILAPNLESVPGAGGLDGHVDEIRATCAELDIPLIYALTRRRLSKAIGRRIGGVSIVGVLDVSASQNYKALLQAARRAREEWYMNQADMQLGPNNKDLQRLIRKQLAKKAKQAKRMELRRQKRAMLRAAALSYGYSLGAAEEKEDEQAGHPSPVPTVSAGAVHEVARADHPARVPATRTPGQWSYATEPTHSQYRILAKGSTLPSSPSPVQDMDHAAWTYSAMPAPSEPPTSLQEAKHTSQTGTKWGSSLRPSAKTFTPLSTAASDEPVMYQQFPVYGVVAPSIPLEAQSMHAAAVTPPAGPSLAAVGSPAPSLLGPPPAFPANIDFAHFRGTFSHKGGRGGKGRGRGQHKPAQRTQQRQPALRPTAQSFVPGGDLQGRTAGAVHDISPNK